jgi:hypothetical protein
MNPREIHTQKGFFRSETRQISTEAVLTTLGWLKFGLCPWNVLVGNGSRDSSPSVQNDRARLDRGDPVK